MAGIRVALAVGAMLGASLVAGSACAPARDEPSDPDPSEPPPSDVDAAEVPPEEQPREEPPEPMTLRDPILFFRPPDPGLRYAYYEGERENLADLREADPARRGETTELAIPVPGGQPFSLELDGFIEVPADGVYRFFVESTDGSRLLIGDDVIVDNDGRHERRERSGVVGLQAGYHQLTVRYFNVTGATHLRVSIAGPGLDRQPVPAKMLFR